MSLYRRGKVWWMDFYFHGQRIQETTEMTSITRTRTELDWKQWVSREEPDISVKVLTRAVNNGELKVPMKARK